MRDFQYTTEGIHYKLTYQLTEKWTQLPQQRRTSAQPVAPEEITSLYTCRQFIPYHKFSDLQAMKSVWRIQTMLVTSLIEN